MAEITSATRKTIPNPHTFADVRVFIPRAYPKNHFRYQMLQQYPTAKINKREIATSRFAMCVRTSMLNYLKSLQGKISFADGALIYSMWDGYKTQPAFAEFLHFCEESGLEVIPQHAGGHADEKAIRELIDHTNPTKIIPIHTENAKWFEENFTNSLY
ncbi:MAG: hypothetical protein FWC16_04865 [Defluviitaleaceae bacterium]|nr:hypothetical protein [Defluviitaleaceae bacterium]MCL2274239.1 hypothetical protein [Defluviitaleaceae bacterium]